jgi:phage baseplate assembly protein V
MHTIVNVGGVNGMGRSVATTDERYRPLNLLPGDAYQGDHTGQMIWITGGSIINVVANATINITAPTVNVFASTAANLTSATATIKAHLVIQGNVDVTGAITSTGNMTAAGIDLDSHHHTGVQTGSGNTGGPAG